MAKDSITVVELGQLERDPESAGHERQGRGGCPATSAVIDHRK